MDAPTAHRRPLAGWALLTAVALASLAVVLGGCGDSVVASPETQIDQAKNVAAKAEILAVETGIRAYQAMNGRLPADASQATLGSFVDPWPKNPWTGGPMQPGPGKGDFTYAQTNSGFSLTVHIDGGEYSRP